MFRTYGLGFRVEGVGLEIRTWNLDGGWQELSSGFRAEG